MIDYLRPLDCLSSVSIDEAGDDSRRSGVTSALLDAERDLKKEKEINLMDSPRKSSIITVDVFDSMQEVFEDCVPVVKGTQKFFVLSFVLGWLGFVTLVVLPLLLQWF